MLLLQPMTRSLILLLFNIIGSLLTIVNMVRIDSLYANAIISKYDSLSKDAIIPISGSLNASVTISKNDSFLLHAAINRFDSLCMNVSITTDGSFIVVIIPIKDSLTCYIVFNTDL